MLKCFNKAMLLASLLFGGSSIYSMDFINHDFLIAFANIVKETIIQDPSLLYGREEVSLTSSLNTADSLGTTCGVSFTGRNAKFTKVFLPKMFAKRAAKQVSDTANSINPVAPILRIADSVSAGVTATTQTVGSALSVFTPGRMMLGTLALIILYNSASPIANRLTNITFDIVEGGAKGSINLAGKLVKWGGQKIIKLSKNGVTAMRNYISNLRSEMLKNKKAEPVLKNEDIKQISENSSEDNNK